MLRRNCHHFTPTTIYKTAIVLNNLVSINEKIQEEIGELNIKISNLQQKTDRIYNQMQELQSGIIKTYTNHQSDMAKIYVINICLVCMNLIIR